MKVSKTPFKDLLVVETDLFEDNRGWFTETYSKDKFCEQGIDVDFLQDNHSYSAKRNTLRGIHFQINPKAQAKLVRCTRGAILDVAVDLRKGSDTYKKWFGVALSAENKKQLFIPKGFGHAFLTLTDDVEVQYKVDEYYSKEHDRSIRFDDPELAIDWNVKNPILSEKDQMAPLLKDSDANFSIKVLVTGVNGQLGHDVLERLRQLGIEGIGATRKDFNISNEDQTMKFILRHKPDVVVHCAAYTAVDRAEEEREKCYAVNVEGTKNIAKACKKIDAKMLYVSTDYVFSGEGVMPHKEDDPTNPINYYGYTKKLGEDIVKNMLEKFFIIRTSWLYGKKGKNFVKTMLETAQTQSEVNVVSDQIGSPTYAKDLAVLICDIIQTDKFGIYHGTNEGYCSWYEFAKAIFDKKGIHVKLNSITSDQYPTKAKRPLNSRLSKEKLDEAGFKRLPHWEDGLERYLKEQPFLEQ